MVENSKKLSPGESLEFKFIIPPKMLLNSNRPIHYQAKGQIVRKLRKYGAEVYLEPFDGKDPGVIFEHFNILVEVFPPTRRRLDPPNLYPTVKPLIDAGSVTDEDSRNSGVGVGLWEDDDWTHLESLTFRYGGLSEIPKTYVLKFTITEIEPS